MCRYLEMALWLIDDYSHFLNLFDKALLLNTLLLQAPADEEEHLLDDTASVE